MTIMTWYKHKSRALYYKALQNHHFDKSNNSRKHMRPNPGYTRLAWRMKNDVVYLTWWTLMIFHPQSNLWKRRESRIKAQKKETMKEKKKQILNKLRKALEKK